MSALDFPLYAVGGGLAAPVTMAILYPFWHSGGQFPTERQDRRNSWLDVGFATAGAVGAYAYSTKANITPETRAVAQGSAIALGIIAGVVALPLLLADSK